MDVVASLYGRNHLAGLIERASEDLFIPMTVGGGIRTVDDALNVLRSGADKVAINTAAVNRPELISEIANRFGTQCMVLSVEAKQQSDCSWEVYTDCGRERTGLDVVKWVKQCAELGAGEVLLTSIDQEGTRKGFDLGLTKAVVSNVTIPVIAAGGMGKPEHLVEVAYDSAPDAIAMADILHYDRCSIATIRQFASSHGLKVRAYG